MEYKKPFDQLYDPHKKAQDAIDHAREVRESKLAEPSKKVREDMHPPAPPPHLIADGNLKRCSVCGYPFPADVHPSMSVAFAEHLLKAHQPGQTTEDSSQAALRVVREATENK